jgi:hypothetical protein
MKAFEELLAQDNEYGFPPFVPDQEKALETLYEYIPSVLLQEYCERYKTTDDLVAEPLRFTRPMELLIAGQYLIELTKTQKQLVLDKLKTKFQDLRLVDTQLSDLLAEIELAAMIGQKYEIDLEVPTGVKTKNGEKNSDIYVVELDIFVEVKNYAFGKSADQKRLDKLWQEQFSDPANNGKQLDIVPAKGSPKIEVIGEQPNMTSIAMVGGSPKKQYQSMIRNAESKFTANQRAVLVITGTWQAKVAAEAVQDWYAPKQELSPIKAVVMLESRQAFTYKKTQHLIELEDAETVQDFLAKMTLNS